LVGVAVLLVGVGVASVAGFGRDRALKGQQQTSGSFVVGLLMAAVSGVLSSFMSFVFVYSQAPIVAGFSDVERGKTITVTVSGRKHECKVASDGALALDALGGTGTVVLDDVNAAEAGRLVAKSLGSVEPDDVRVETGSISATFAVFAVGLIGGALLNIGYAAYLLTRNRSWGVLLESKKELLLSLVIGVNFSVAVTLMGKGMLLLGALGASVGFGIQQAMQMTGGQLLGFVSGEWRGVHGKPRIQMYAAIAVLIAASLILAYGNTLSKN
jgi:hypothetical protein